LAVFFKSNRGAFLVGIEVGEEAVVLADGC
jgi:hypothetical protein